MNVKENGDQSTKKELRTCQLQIGTCHGCLGFPGGTSAKESTYQCRRLKRCRFSSWVGKIPWRRKWQPTPVFLPGKSHGQGNLVGYSPLGIKEGDTIERLSLLYILELDIMVFYWQANAMLMILQSP